MGRQGGMPSDSMVTEMSERFHVRQQRSIRIYKPIDLDLMEELGRSGGTPYSGAGPQLVAAGRLSQEKGFDLPCSRRRVRVHFGDSVGEHLACLASRATIAQVIEPRIHRLGFQRLQEDQEGLKHRIG
jgi:hypothetical protein